MAAGIVVTSIADGVYALRVATGGDGSPLLDALWISAQLVMALGAWPAARDSGLELSVGGWRMLVWPATFALTALGVLAWFAGGQTPRRRSCSQSRRCWRRWCARDSRSARTSRCSARTSRRAPTT